MNYLRSMLLELQSLGSKFINWPYKQITRQLMQTSFVHHPLLRNSHAQTIISTLLPRRTPLLKQNTQTRFFDVAPGVRILGHCSWQQKNRATTPCIIVVHGLGGSSRSPYMLGIAEKALVLGYNVIRLNLRNCGDIELSPTFYNAGVSPDIRCVINELIQQDGMQEIYLIGFSLSGNISLKYAGEEGQRIPKALRAVIAVSPSIDLHASVSTLEQRSNAFYHFHFTRNLKNALRKRAHLFNDSNLDLSLINSVWSLRKFDDLYTAPHSGYKGADDYYTRASSLPFIPSIAVPTLIIHSTDDPFIPYGPLKSPEVTCNPNVILLITDHGGHCGFITAKPECGDRYWAELRAMEFIQLLKNTHLRNL